MSDRLAPVRNPAAVLREEFDDWAVLFNPDTAQAVGLNPVGVAVWKLLDGKRNVEDVLEEIHSTYRSVPENAREDMLQFIDDLKEGGFVGVEVEDFER